jgi:hypothetical protein
VFVAVKMSKEGGLWGEIGVKEGLKLIVSGRSEEIWEI